MISENHTIPKTFINALQIQKFHEYNNSQENKYLPVLGEDIDMKNRWARVWK
jgi:hypothetical protein